MQEKSAGGSQAQGTRFREPYRFAEQGSPAWPVHQKFASPPLLYVYLLPTAATSNKQQGNAELT